MWYSESVYENEKGLLEHFPETEEDKAAEIKEYRDMKKNNEPISALPERGLYEYETI